MVTKTAAARTVAALDAAETFVVDCVKEVPRIHAAPTRVWTYKPVFGLATKDVRNAVRAHLSGNVNAAAHEEPAGWLVICGLCNSYAHECPDLKGVR